MLQGLTFTRLIEEVRFEQARSLLTDPRIKITDIAFELGYSHVAHFTRAFRRIVLMHDIHQGTADALGPLITELKARGYDHNLAMGSLAGAGTMGFLIPPSILMVLYALITEVSIGKLFAAGDSFRSLLYGAVSGCLVAVLLAPGRRDGARWVPEPGPLLGAAGGVFLLAAATAAWNSRQQRCWI